LYPDYLANTTGKVSTDNFYWTSRLIAALADAGYKKNLNHIERYELSVQSKANHILNVTDDRLSAETDPQKRSKIQAEANEQIAVMAEREASKALSNVLFEVSSLMKNSYARSDA